MPCRSFRKVSKSCWFTVDTWNFYSLTYPLSTLISWKLKGIISAKALSLVMMRSLNSIWVIRVSLNSCLSVAMAGSILLCSGTVSKDCLL